MASIRRHAEAALGIGAAFYRPGMPKRVWVLGAACSMVPDADVIGFHFGVRYQDFWGHRGFTHSLPFAALFVALVTVLGFRNAGSRDRRQLCFYFFVATASHGLFDAMTNGRTWCRVPFPYATRYFLP